MYNVYTYLSGGSVIIPFLAGLFRLRDQRNMPWLFFYLVSIAAVFEFISITLVKYASYNTHFVINMYNLFDTPLLTVILTSITGNRLMRKIGLVLLAAFLCIFFIRLAGGHFHFMDPIVSTASSVLLVFLAGWALYSQSQNPDFTWQTSEFWIITSVLFYYSLSVSVHAFAPYLISYSDNAIGSIYFICIHAAINILGNIGYAMAFVCKQTTTK